MRAALEDLLRVPDQAPEIDGQLHPRLPRAHHLVAQHAQVLLQLHGTQNVQITTFHLPPIRMKFLSRQPKKPTQLSVPQEEPLHGMQMNISNKQRLTDTRLRTVWQSPLHPAHVALHYKTAARSSASVVQITTLGCPT